MPIDFHSEQNRLTYTTRIADLSWLELMKENIDVLGKEVVDIGCGGGIYTKALNSLGAWHVTGVDFSEEMLRGASKNCEGMENVSFLPGDAYNSRLPANKFDIVLERALIHHLDDLNSCFKEASRILKNDGVLIVQDRTPDDCLQPGSDNHIRGYFFDKYPKLINKEVSRRHDSKKVLASLQANGFQTVKEVQLWETREVYSDFEALSKDLLQRTGRSILHELTDEELRELVLFIKEKLNASRPPIIEKDSWTIWFAINK
jgi:ubiquinone/menaquinone biosynthesis C-methylase UbiE